MQTQDKALTENHHDRLDELDGRPLAAYGAAGVRRQHGRLLLDIQINPYVNGHHDEKHHQVGHRPEDQVTPAEDGRQLRAVAQVADAVPAQAGHSAHEDRDGPHQHDQQGHPPLGQIAVDLPVHDRYVALQSDNQQVGEGGREADVQETLTDEVSLHRERPRHLARVEHEVHVGDPCQEVRGGEVGQQVVEGVVKPLVGDDGSYDHGIGGQDETAEDGAHDLHQDELRLVPFIFSATFVVEEAHRLVKVTAEVS